MTYDDLKLEDFANAKWLDVLNYVQTPHYMDYNSEYDAAAKKWVESGNERCAYALVFIQQITSIHLKTDSPNDPFEPMGSGDGWRAIIPSDLSKHQRELLHGLVENCTDPEMRARMNDILWVTEKDHAAGRAAIDDYLNSAGKLRDANHLKFDPKIKRAIQLAAMLGGRQNELLPKCKTFVLEILEESFNNADYSKALGMVEILLNHRLEKPVELIAHLDTIVNNFISNKRYYEAHDAMGLLYTCLKRAKKEDEAKSISLRESELYEIEADKKAADGHYLVASDFLMKSISIRRNLGEGIVELDSIYKKLADYQQRSADNMGVISTEIKISEEEVNGIKNFVHGYDFLESLIRFTRALNPRGKEETQKNYDTANHGLVLHRIVPMQIITQRGAVIGQIPPFNPNADDEDAEERLMMHLYQHSSFSRKLDSIYIDMMREEIYFEHHPEENDFLQFLRNHPFIESGHERIYARAIKAGINRDWIICAHLLIPQVENSLRHILRSAGVNVTKINQDGTQVEIILGEIFSSYKNELIAMLGEPTYFNLRGLLITKYSTNLRNLALHGLMTEDDFENSETVYLWWLILRILLAPFRINLPPASENSEVETIIEKSEEIQLSHEVDTEKIGDNVTTHSPEPSQEITAIGFSRKSWGPADGSWHVLLENMGPELAFVNAEIPENDLISLTTIPRESLLVRTGGYINIAGKVDTDLEVTDAGNPQGMYPFSFDLYFRIGEKLFKQRCLTEKGLSSDFSVENSVLQKE